MDFGDLDDDKSLKEKLLNVHNSVDEIEQVIQTVLKKVNYGELSPVEKVNYDLFNSYALNVLCWMYLRVNGQDPNETSIKSELNRVKIYMLRAKQAQEKHLRPKVDKPAAARFIKHGLDNANKADTSSSSSKKRKYSHVS